MDDMEARYIVAIMLKADGGCPNCARELLKFLVSNFPEHEKLCGDMFLREFDEEL